MPKKMTVAALAALCMLPTAALAHTGIGDAHGLAHGLMHPLGGLDHLIAMVIVGMLAYQLGGRALWAVPATFVLVLAISGATGMAGVPIPFVELGIALSSVVLGAVVAFGVKAPVAAAVGLVGLFAVFHGHAHGAEMPADASGLGYALGFTAATAILHAIGIAIGRLIGGLSKSGGAAVYGAAGGAASVAGLAILAGYL